ncbi:hypothetical protein [Streptomyces mirabilis]|uniref:hypothetical protein n=1 Tax=Streptomyces mirabilis TaxID=68239 RepID=UPI0036B416F0
MTAQEWEVARPAATGRTNKQIAERLFLPPDHRHPLVPDLSQTRRRLPSRAVRRSGRSRPRGCRLRWPDDRTVTASWAIGLAWRSAGRRRATTWPPHPRTPPQATSHPACPVGPARRTARRIRGRRGVRAGGTRRHAPARHAAAPTPAAGAGRHAGCPGSPRCDGRHLPGLGDMHPSAITGELGCYG